MQPYVVNYFGANSIEIKYKTWRKMQMSKESSFQKFPFQTIGFSSHLQLARARAQFPRE